MALVLIVEEDGGAALKLRGELLADGHTADIVNDGDAGEKAAMVRAYDLILLCASLTRRDGCAVCRSLRAAGVDVPIIFVTARAREAERLLGFEVGADDVVSKPYSPRELLARIKAVLRRAARAGNSSDLFEYGDLAVNFRKFETIRAGKPLGLTPTEYRLLGALVRNRGRVLSIAELIDLVWGHGVSLSDRVVYTNVNKLRKKIEPNPASPALVVGVRGIGYKLGV